MSMSVRAAIAALLLLAGVDAAPAFAQNEIGRVTAVNPAAGSRLTPTAPERVLFIGNGVHQSERITTNDGGRAHLMFTDQSALTIGPNSEVVLDRFVYDPGRDTGTLAVRATRGTLRFIGGRVSKAGEVTIGTPAGTLGIRGGIGIASINADGSVLVVMLYGQSIRVPLSTGQSLLINRPGFAIRVPHEF